MARRIRRFANRFIVTSVLGGSAVLQLGFLPSCQGLLRTVNPCSFLGFCQEQDIDLLTAQNLPDFEIDPTCTIPFATGPGCAGQPILPTPGPRP